MVHIAHVGQAAAPLRHAVSWSALVAAIATLAACTSVGSGIGEARSGGAPVRFDWTSKDGGITGTMTATLNDGSTLSGPFLQLTSTTRYDTLEPLWLGWPRGWDDWGFRDAYPNVAFATRYSGKVVANLKGAGDKRLRCRFHLNAPETGMHGGGQGECQSNAGETVDAVFDRP